MSNLTTRETVKAIEKIAKQTPYKIKVFDDKKLQELSEKLVEVDRATASFGRKNSQAANMFMTLTMLNGQSPYRILRQCLAEIDKKRSAIREATIKLKKKQRQLDKTDDDILKAQLFGEINGVMQHIEGALKDIAFHTDASEKIRVKHNIPADWDEADFEAKEPWHHTRRGFELLYHNLIERGRIGESTIEYLGQFGIHAQTAIKVMKDYISQVDEMVEKGYYPDSQHYEDFLDSCANKFEPEHKKVVNRMFGGHEYQNKNFMFLEGKNDR